MSLTSAKISSIEYYLPEQKLTNEELQAMTQTQLASMVKDHDINELLLNDQREFTNEELAMMTDKLRRWEK